MRRNPKFRKSRDQTFIKIRMRNTVRKKDQTNKQLIINIVENLLTEIYDQQNVTC